MKQKLLFLEEQQTEKEILIYKNPRDLKLILDDLSWRILQMIGEKAMYPMEIARKLGVHEQIVYYHVRKLFNAKAIKKVKEEERKGAIAKYYNVTYPAFGIELPFGKRRRQTSLRPMAKKVSEFLQPILHGDSLEGKIVVGSPEPHGPFKTSARDGHYAAYLSLYLGQYTRLPDEFVIKLDVDVKVEKEEKNNLILVGGPGTNLITQEINNYLPIQFNMTSSEHGFIFGGLVSEKSKKTYTADTMGMVAKITNPWDSEKKIIVLAGNKAVGTKACVLALVRYSETLLKDYCCENSFATVIQGFDLCGDGKVDSIEILE